MKIIWFRIAFLLAIASPAAAQWPLLNTSGETIYSIASLGNNIFAGTISGVYRSTDSGSNWQRWSNGLPDNFVQTLASHGHTVFAGGYDGVYRSTDSGASWSLSLQGINPFGLDLILGVSGSAVYVREDQYLHISTDDGNSWYLADSNLTMAAEPEAIVTFDSITYAAGTWIISTGDNGKYWRVVAVPASDEFSDVTSLAAIGNTLFEVNDGQLQESTDSGMSWNPLYESDYFDAGFLTVVGTDLFGYGDGSIIRSSDTGVTWQYYENGLPAYPYVKSLSFAAGVLFAGIEDFGMYRSFDSGATWSQCNSGIGQDIGEIGPMEVFPNPCSGFSSIYFPEFIGAGELTLFSEDGSTIWKQDIMSEAKPIPIDLGRIENGNYWLELRSGTAITSAKVLVER